MLDAKLFFDSVTVAGATVMVAVIAVPLELITMMVWLALSVCMAISVALVPVPMKVERPGVRVKVIEPKVMWLLFVALLCADAMLAVPCVIEPGMVAPV